MPSLVRRLGLVLVAALFLVPACGKEADPTGSALSIIDDEARVCDVPFRTVAGLENPSFNSNASAGVVSTVDQFCRLWDEVAFPGGIPCDPAAVDFDKEAVLVAGGTWYNTGGYAIEVDCVQTGAEAGRLEVFLALQVPGPSCVVTQAFTNPLAIVKVPRPAVSASFTIDRTLTMRCN